MEIRVDRVSLTPSSLRVSCVVHGPQDSWVKFAEVFVPLTLIPWNGVRDALMRDEVYDPQEETTAPLF